MMELPGQTEPRKIVPAVAINMKLVISYIHKSFPNIKMLDVKQDDLLESCITRVQAMSLYEQLAGAVLEYGETEDIFEFLKQLCHFCA